MLSNRKTPFDVVPPRYQVVAEALSQAIKSGQYPVGSFLPNENELCRQFEVSRHTIREAIRKLKEFGLISRHQGIGTRVENSDVSEGRYVVSLGSIPDLWQYVQKLDVRTLRKKIIKSSEADLPLPKTSSRETWLFVELLRSNNANRLPILISQIYVNDAFKGISNHISREAVPVFSLIEQEYGEKVFAIKQEISAAVLTEKQAKLLKAKVKSPALCIVRHYLNADETVLEVSRVITPADRFTYSMDVRLEYPWKRGD